MNRGEELPAETWAEEALCAEVDSLTFRSVDTIPTALGICSHCPVSRECLTWALDNNITTDTWGNKTARQRRHLSSEDVAFWPPPLIPSIVITAGPVPGGPVRIESGIMARSERPAPDSPAAVPDLPPAEPAPSPTPAKPKAAARVGDRKPPSNCDARCSETGTNASVRHDNRGEAACRASLDAARRYRANQKAEKAAFEARKAAGDRPAEALVAAQKTMDTNGAPGAVAEDGTVQVYDQLAPGEVPVPAPVVWVNADTLLDEAAAIAPEVRTRVQIRWLVPREVIPPGVSYEYSYRTEDGQKDVVISRRIAEIRASQGKLIRRRTVTAWQDVGGGDVL